MELFSEPIKEVAAFCIDAAKRGQSSSYEVQDLIPWPKGSSLILQEDTVLQYGGAEGSLFMIMWTGDKSLIRPGRVTMIGSDHLDHSIKALPLAQVVLVGGDFSEDYQTYQGLLDLILATRFLGVAARYWPDRQRVWYRVGREALKSGFNLVNCGAALHENLVAMPDVFGVEIMFSTEKLELPSLLLRAGKRASSTLETLLQIYEELVFDCDNCDYKEICAEVTDLKEIHRRMHREGETGG